jgi:cytochrome P450
MQQRSGPHPADDPYFSGALRLTAASAVAEVLRSKLFTTAEHEECFALTGGTVIRLDGPAHLTRRRLQAGLFSREALKFYEDRLLVPTIERGLADLARSRDPDGVVRADLMAVSRKMMLHTSAAIIGLDGVDDPVIAERFGTYRDLLMAGTSVERRVGGHAPVLRKARNTKRHFVSEFFVPSAQRRRTLVAEWRAGRLERDDLPLDLLTLLIVHGLDESDEDLVVRECILYLAASTNTTSMVITDTAKELSDWMTRHQEDLVLLGDDRFLRQAIDEALRLHPPAEVLRRRAIDEVTLGNGAVLPGGQLVAADLGSANRDPAIFGDDADVFNPRRLVREGSHRYGHAFGAGAHMCIGRPLVLPSTSNAAEPTQGAIAQILRALYAAGMVVDTLAPAEHMQTFYPHVAKLPVLFERL